MKKALIVSTVSRQFSLFEQGNIETLVELGYEVHAAANYSDADDRLNSLNIVRHHIDIERSPFSLKNIKAYKQLKKLMDGQHFDVVHSHSPVGGVLGRLAAKKAKVPKVLYTAHGFHFFKGAPLKNWLLFYPVERSLAKITDYLVTINQEDFERAKKFKVRGSCVNVPGIGFDSSKFELPGETRALKRKELGISENTLVILTIGEMIKRKNHRTMIEAFAKADINNSLLLICGRGELLDELKALTRELGVEDKVSFLGYRKDIPEICKMSDIFIFSSFQEGLPVSVMEAMAAGLPVVASDIRGSSELVIRDKGGYLMKPKDVESFANYTVKLASDPSLRAKMREWNLKKVKNYEKGVVKSLMLKVYSSL